MAAFKLARRWFIQSRKIDMQDLAAELGVSRATLFRWVGNRDTLITEIIWSLAERTFNDATAGAAGTGGRRIAAIIGETVRTVNRAPFYRSYLKREPERALRLFTTQGSIVQRRAIAYFEELLREEAERGTLQPPLPLHDLAYVIVRIGEGFIYTDLITGDAPDADKAEQAIAALLT